jgi:exodeoxyribonuclease V alpha subunit
MRSITCSPRELPRMLHDALFERALEQQRLRPLDVAFARFLAERDVQTAPVLLWLAALLSRQLADGHLCLDLTQLSALAHEQDWPEDWRALAASVPDSNAPRLPSSPLLAANSNGLPADAPLVLDGARLYLRRYWNHERQVAHGILDRVTRVEIPPAHFADELARLFPDAGSPDWQRIACALAARGAFAVITGGPGTGKTTTVVRLLGLLQTLQLREHARPLRIRLAAPTGKAATRLNASIAAQLAELDVDETVRAAIPAQVGTLHRLLGARPDTRHFRYNQANPLHLDVLVIDEASMIDLEMMSAVLAALPDTSRLILLGDKDQLSSVEAGAVLGDLCRRAQGGHYDNATAQWLKVATGEDVAPFVTADASALDQQVAMLRDSHRFDAASGIGRLATAVNMGDAPAVHQLLTAATTDVIWEPSAAPPQLVDLAIDGRPGTQEDNGEANARGYRHYLQQLRHQRPADDAGNDAFDGWADETLHAFNRFQLLCALRRGPYGVEGLNRQMAEALQTRGLIDSRFPLAGLGRGDEGWYEGRPVMVTRNDYSLGLSNGDVGICLRFPDGQGRARLAVAFPASTAPDARGSMRVRRILPTRLNDVATAYAMTVHKSQGSEFEHTLLALPPDPSPVLTRELLYTGITRARRWFTLAANAEIVDLAIQQRTRRYSGLAERLFRC